MFSFLSRRTELSVVNCDAKMLASLIVSIAEEVAPRFTRAFTKNNSPNLERVLMHIKLELCALYLHLCDRDAFLEAGEGAARDRFLDSLFKAVSAEVEETLQVDRGHFTDFCNQRQTEFSRHKNLTAPWGELEGTLFWEFGKKLALQYEAHNAVGVQLFILATTDSYLELRKRFGGSKSLDEPR